MIKYIKEDLNKWTGILSSWIGRFNIVYISFISELSYKFNIIPTNGSASLIVDTDKLIIKFMWNGKLLRIAKTILMKKNNNIKAIYLKLMEDQK